MNTFAFPFARGLSGLIAGLTLGGYVQAVAACEVRSGQRTAALVELYTSEGCSSCPPADRQLSRLKQTLDPNAEFVPLSLHVDYWDAIGWKDPFAQSRFDERQSELVRLAGRQTVYTPQFFVAGKEVRSWPTNLNDAVREVNARQATADLQIETRLVGPAVLAVRVRATAAGNGAALYVLLTENGLVSRVMRGENGGATLEHDHVVRAFYGPIALADGRSEFVRELPLAGTNPRNVDVAAFVAEPRSGVVRQALAATACSGS